MLVAGVAAGCAVGATTLVGNRWITDMLSKDEYGVLIRSIDSSESNVRKPYEIVAAVGFSTAGLSLFVFLIYKAIPPNLLVVLASILVGLGMYSILGSLTLIRITRRHSARAARIRALKEKNARDQRMRRRDLGNEQ
ncbi:hypothetical protein ABZ518_24280 [Rhodococcus sp. NPDC019616]